MRKRLNIPDNQSSESMIVQKTNEDFNKKKPDPKDPNEQKGHPNPAAPIIAYDKEKATKDKASNATTDPKNIPNKSDGSE